MPTPKTRRPTRSSPRDLELLYEVGCLRFIPRTWKQFLNPDVENLAEHSLRVIWIALIIAQHEGPVNTDKLMKMALIHDLSESRCVDVHYVSRQYVVRHEEEAMKDTLADTAIEHEFLKLWQEYEEKSSLEAQIVKDADNLDVDLEFREQAIRGFKLGTGKLDHRKLVAEHKLYTPTAKKLWQKIQKSNPNDWHAKGKNRFTAGDWKV